MIGALKKHGMDSHGKSLKGLNEESRKNELSGTLELLVLQGYGSQADGALLAKDADAVIESLLQSGLGSTNKRSHEKDLV